MTDRVNQILDVAEQAIRRGGLDHVSFRDLASAVGIKSASVHYHFPTKADLAKAVVARYSNRFLEWLGDPTLPTQTPKERIMRLVDGYEASLKADASTCLCAVLGAVQVSLPPGTADEVNAFYVALLSWIEKALAGADTALTPVIAVSTLQGAMVLEVAGVKRNVFDEVRAFFGAMCD